VDDEWKPLAERLRSVSSSVASYSQEANAQSWDDSVEKTYQDAIYSNGTSTSHSQDLASKYNGMEMDSLMGALYTSLQETKGPSVRQHTGSTMFC
jgi:hypothetical protein